jgi:hypothetical protein
MFVMLSNGYIYGIYSATEIWRHTKFSCVIVALVIMLLFVRIVHLIFEIDRES